jgi:hypothetical protein
MSCSCGKKKTQKYTIKKFPCMHGCAPSPITFPLRLPLHQFSYFNIPPKESNRFPPAYSSSPLIKDGRVSDAVTFLFGAGAALVIFAV